MGFNSPPSVPLESADQRLLRALDIAPGTRIQLTKESVAEASHVPVGSILDGVTDQALRIGEPISLNNGSSRTSPVMGVSREDGKILIRTQTSVYRLRTGNLEQAPVSSTILSTDLERFQREYRTKGYGEWDLNNGKVPLVDDPFQLLFKSYGLAEGDRVRFFVEREREGVIATRLNGALEIRDNQGLPWGTMSILNSEGGYITRASE